MVVQRHQLSRRTRVAKIATYPPQWAAICRAPFDAIADVPLFDEVPDRSSVGPPTLRQLIKSQGQQRSYRGRVLFPLGPLERVVGKLESARWRVAVDDQPEAKFFFPDGALTEHPSSRPAMLKHAYCRVYSLAHVPRSSDRLRIVAALRSQFPDAHLLVVAKNQTQASHVTRRLEKLLGQPVTCCNERRTEFPWTHVDCVGTFGGRHIPDWMFVVFWNAELVLKKTTLVQLSLMWESIRIGFLSAR